MKQSTLLILYLVYIGYPCLFYLLELENSYEFKWYIIYAPHLMTIILFFIALIILALSKNIDTFKNYIHYVFIIVLIHNILALTLGYSIASISGLSKKDRRTLAIETGIQNSGLGMLLIFSFFNGLGGMALVAAFWGVWHIVSGLIIATYWSKRQI